MWNKVTESFPNEDGEYLVIINGFVGNYIRIADFYKTVEKGNYYYDSSCWGKKNVFTNTDSESFGYELNNVSHWTKLPALPVESRRCKDCDCCRLGYFTSKPDKYVCTGVREPFVINDINNLCTEYNEY